MNKKIKKNDSKTSKKKNIWLIVIIVIVVIIMIFLGLKLIKNDDDSLAFAKEYDLKNEDGTYIENVFVYRDIEEILDIIEHGTGLVYLGFPECPWCSEYIKHLNEVAMDEGVDKIYYKNLLVDRMANSKNYKKLVKLLDKYLQYDEEGHKKIYVPAVIAVKDGEIVGFNDETSWDTKGYDNAKEYWSHEDLEGLKNTFIKMITDTNKNICTSGCNK